jgi:kumamolisin
MKRSIEFMLASAIAMVFGLATSAPAQMVYHPLVKSGSAESTGGAPVNNRQLPSQGLTRIVSGEGRVYSPASSVAPSGSAGLTAHTDVEVFVPNGFQPDQVTPPYTGFGFNTPATTACIYRVQSGTHVPFCTATNSGLTNPSGGAQTIAIVDAYDDPWILDDVNTFSTQFELPLMNSGNFQVVYASGTEPAFDTADNGGWELEESLDAEYAHAMAPNAKIILVEAANNQLASLQQAITVAGNEVECGQATTCGSQTGSGEVVMSWGTSEFAGETADDSWFTTPGVVYLAASGDEPGVSWPCSSPSVVCVGATTYSRFPSTTPVIGTGQQPFAGQVQGSWELTGGGSSLYEPIPSYQGVLAATLTALNNSTATTSLGYAIGVGLSTTNRAVPDISVNGNPNTGYWVYDSFQFALLGYIPPATDAPDAGGWWIVGGTSAANSVFAGMVNLAASNPTISGATVSGGSFKASSAAELTVIYSNIASTYPSTPLNVNLSDIIGGTGQCGPYISYTAAAGWDPCTGVGTPNGVGGI